MSLARPRVVMLIGNGFTVGLLSHMSLIDRIDSRCMAPPSEGAMYLPIDSDDQIKAQPLWDYPFAQSIRKEIESGIKFYDLCGILSQDPFTYNNQESGINAFTNDEPNNSVDLRIYLWDLFRYHQHVALSTPLDVSRFPWSNVFRALHGFCSLSIVSFNYDINAELILHYSGLASMSMVEDCSFALDPDKSIIPVIKPHGCIAHGLTSMASSIVSMIHMSRNSLFLNNRIDRFSEPIGFPPTFRPSIPDIVPPGFAGAPHFMNPNSNARAVIGQLMASCDGLIVCGLSAREPDTSEIGWYVSRLREGVQSFHVSPQDIMNEPIEGLLRAKNRVHVSPSDVGAIPDLVRSLLGS